MFAGKRGEAERLTVCACSFLSFGLGGGDGSSGSGGGSGNFLFDIIRVSRVRRLGGDVEPTSGDLALFGSDLLRARRAPPDASSAS